MIIAQSVAEYGALGSASGSGFSSIADNFQQLVDGIPGGGWTILAIVLLVLWLISRRR